MEKSFANGSKYRWTLYWQFLRKHTSLTHFILVSMVLGILIGWACGKDAVFPGKILMDIFLRPVKALIVPLIFSSLVYGIAGHGDLARVGRLFWKSLVYFEVVTTLALFLGLLAVDVIKPGKGIVANSADNTIVAKTTSEMVQDFIYDIFTDSFFRAAAENKTLGVVICAIFFSIGLMYVKPNHRKVMINWCHSLSEIMFQVTWMVMFLAPLGVMGALMKTIGEHGFEVLINLAILVGTLYGSLIVFVLIVLLPIMIMFKIPIKGFCQIVRRPAVLAFTTSSSESALPMAMQLLEDFGVPKSIVSFVLPVGYSFNLDGTTLYLAIASRFAAQFANVEQSFGTQLTMMLVLMLVSKGVAAVPRASLIILTTTCAQFQIPENVVAIVFGVDTFMDMARTAVNLVGNCLAAVVIAKWENRFGVPDEELTLHEEQEEQVREMEAQGQ